MSTEIEERICSKCNIGKMELWSDKFVDMSRLHVLQYIWFECNHCHERDYTFTNSPLESEEMIGGE